ncbi:CBS domain-containing protein [Chloroflexota bacterium]
MRKLSKLLIRDVYDTDVEPPVVISQEDEIVKIIKLFSASSELRSIFVTDREGKFAGVITRSNMLDWMRAQLGDYFEEGGQSPDKTISLSNIIQATTVGEMLFPGSEMAAVRLENTANDAMRKMVELDTIVLSVIDAADQVIGEIKLSEILTASLEDNC